jgi:hypothetical protein
VRPVGLAGNHGAAGAKIRVYAAGTDQLLWYEELGIYCRQAQSGYGYHGALSERHFGLGERTKVDLTVEFYPSHKLVRQSGVDADTTVRIAEDGAGSVVSYPPAARDGGTDAAAPDAGSDAGTRTRDAGPSQEDASAAADAAVAEDEDSEPSVGDDADADVDSSEDTRAHADGCACAVARPSAPERSLFWFGLASLLALRRSLRRRPHHQNANFAKEL